MTPEKRRGLVGLVRHRIPLLHSMALDQLVRAAAAGDRECSHELIGLFLEDRAELAQLKHPAARSAIVLEWARTREPRLQQLLLKTGWVADSPAAARVLSLLLHGRGSEIALGGDRWAPALLQACADPELGGPALQALDALPDREAREAACQAVLDSAFPPEPAVEVLVRRGWAPEEQGPRALFYFVTGQYERFEDLDYDHSLLQAAYSELPDGLRARVINRIRGSGRAGLVRILQTDESRRRLHGLTISEYEAVLQVLQDSGRVGELWSMVFTASPEWSAEFLGVLQDHGFEPPAEDLEAYDNLQALRPTRGRHLRLQLPEVTLNASRRAFDTGIRGLAFSPNGKLLAAGGKSEVVRLFDPYRGSLEGELPGHAGVVTALAFSPDSRVLATGGSDHGAYLWDPHRGRQLQRIFPESAPVGTLTMAFSPSGRYLAVGGWETAVLVRLEDFELLPLEGHTECVVAVAFDPQERWIATASWDRTVRVWDLPSARRSRVLKGHDDHVVALAFTDNGEHLISAGHDGRVLSWSNGKPTQIGFHQPPIWRMAVHPQGKLVATSGADNFIRLWEHARDYKFEGSVGGRTSDMAFSPDGQFLSRASRIGDLSICQLLNHPDGLEVLDVPRASERNKTTGHPESLAFSPDSRTLAAGHDDGTIAFWSLFQTKPVGRMDQADLNRIEGWLKRVPPADRPAWEFVAALVRHRFRHAVQLGEASGALLDEFAIDID